MSEYVEVRGRIVVQRHQLRDVEFEDDPRVRLAKEDALITILGRMAYEDLRDQVRAANEVSVTLTPRAA